MSRGGFQDKKPPPMKITIEPLAVAPKLPDNFEENTWAELKAAVDAVHSKEPISTSMEHLYRMVEDLCIHKMAERIYGRLEEACDKHIQSQLGGLAAMEEALDPVAFLEHMASCWSDHCKQVRRAGRGGMEGMRRADRLSETDTGSEREGFALWLLPSSRGCSA